MTNPQPASSRVTCALFLALLQAWTISAPAKPRVVFISPCECEGNHGVSRWAAKTDLEEPPDDSHIKKVTPGEISRWPGPGVKLNQRSERIAAENQWYAVTGRIEKVKTEADGDLHIELRDLAGDAGLIVEIPLGPRWCELRETVFSWTSARFPLSGKFRLLQHPVVTVVGKAFYDVDHSGKDAHANRRNYDHSLAVWEIHPVMEIAVESSDSPRTEATPSPTISSPTTTATAKEAPGSEQFVTLTRPVTIQIPFGTTVLKPGTKVPVLSRDAQSVDVRYLDSRYTIPISSTDLD